MARGEEAQYIPSRPLFATAAVLSFSSYSLFPLRRLFSFPSSSENVVDSPPSLSLSPATAPNTRIQPLSFCVPRQREKERERRRDRIFLCAPRSIIQHLRARDDDGPAKRTSLPPCLFLPHVYIYIWRFHSEDCAKTLSGIWNLGDNSETCRSLRLCVGRAQGAQPLPALRLE